MSGRVQVSVGPGTLLDGRYRVMELLGEGSMGRVFEGDDLSLGRRVALKVMREASVDEIQNERLFREARAAARAEHPAVVTTYGYGIDPELDVHYVVMERLRGETVGQRLARVGALSVPLAIRIGGDVADALSAVHEAGVIHRDLKPSNVFLASRGRRTDEVKLLDFGVAKHDDLHPLTATGEVYGTPMYMAPEQLTNSKAVDLRCDLYALGAVLFECLTGRPPYRADSAAALLAQIMIEPVPSVDALRPDVPPALAAIVACCLQKQRTKRFRSALSVRDALYALSCAERA